MGSPRSRAQAQAEKQEQVAVRMVYLGRRYDSDGKVGHLWALESDIEETRLFPKVRGLGVGSVYEVIATDETACRVYQDSAAYTGDQYGDQAQRAVWQSEDRATQDQDSRRKAERSLARRTDLDRIFEELEDLARKMPNRHAAAALAKQASDRVTDAYYSKGK